MKELIYLFHIQAENRHCFLLLTCVHAEQLSVCEPALLQVRVTCTVCSGSYRWIPGCWPWSVFLYFGESVNKHSQLPVGHLSPFLSAASWFLCSAGFIQVGFFSFLASLPHVSSLAVFPCLFFIFLIVETKLNSLPKIIMDLSSPEHNLAAAYVSALVFFT